MLPEHLVERFAPSEVGSFEPWRQLLKLAKQLVFVVA